ncbi:nicalin, partial [Carlito syrichta]|uniref:Nicalin n=1 Tax=Carlito syrichta TaxID=1868482 RepID=A0A3Q0DMS2_CARSF
LASPSQAPPASLAGATPAQTRPLTRVRPPPPLSLELQPAGSNAPVQRLRGQQPPQAPPCSQSSAQIQPPPPWPGPVPAPHGAAPTEQSPPPGTRNAVLNTEARTVDADVLSRRCVLMRLVDFSYERYQRALRQSAGAVVIILPRAMAAVPQDVIRQFMEIEPEMLAMETAVPVYFAVEDDALLSVYRQTQAASASQGSASAAEVLLHTATANGFQMVTSGAQSKAVSDWLITSVEGRLTGLGGEDLPTIVLVAHYDAFGVAPVRVRATSPGMVPTHPAAPSCHLTLGPQAAALYNLLFFASGGGKFNYQGTKRWDPEFVFYDQLKQVMNAYRVKPAIFDLLLAVCIGAYLGMAYTAVQHFGLLYKTVQRLLVKAKTP